MIFETKNTRPDMNAKLILITNLIRYKQQVILQGPPGTGKTRLAKQVAAELARPSKISIEDIRKVMKPGLVVESIYDKVKYTVNSVDENGITLQLQNDGNQTRSYASIIQAYSNLSMNKPLEGGDSYQAAIAKYIMDDWKDERQVKIIQFHPGYSYEDFVRGIVVETKGDKMEYRSVNKVLGQISADARKNWEDSQKNIGDVLKENKVREYFEQFSDDLDESIMNGDTVGLTKKVNIIDVEEDAFRYKGSDGWSNLGNRMLFKDLIQAYIDGNQSRKDIKKNKNLSGLANQHATYYIKALNLFVNYLEKEKLGFDNMAGEKTEAKNFVLVIDEINRANLSSVLGELIYALEYRGHGVEGVYEVDGSRELFLPPNLYIIGTMNTADRSVGHIDYAIRRRFAFSYVMPEDLSGEPGIKFHKDLFDAVSALFDTNLSPEFEKRDVQLGHSYFIDRSDKGGTMDVRLEYEIKPILDEYVRDGILVGEDIKTKIENLHA